MFIKRHAHSVFPQKRRIEVVPRKSKSKIDVYTDTTLCFVSQKPNADGGCSMSISLDERKKQAEEPIYLTRV